MISLPSQTTFSGLEQFLRDVRQFPGQDLKLPVQVSRGGAFSFSAVAVQAIATWARLHDGVRRLRVAPQFAEDEVTRSRLAGALYAIGGLYFAQEVVAGSRVIPRSEALEAVAPRVFAMQDYQYRDTLRGPSVALCCFERAKLEFIQSLYAIPRRGTPDTTTIRSASEFKSILSRMLEACSAGASRVLTDVQIEVLAQLVHQLFKNADVHTISDAEGRLYDAGIRGIQVREVVIADDAAFTDFVSGDRALHAYLTKLSRRGLVREPGAHGQESKLKKWQASTFVEISVFDTGPGLALRWLADREGITRYSQVDLEQELQAVKECFQLHASTHSAAMKGDGLPIALRAMKELRAFMFLRTGRLALYQDFSSQEHTGFSPRNRYGVRRLSEAVGATYSICFPLVR
ncbi:hypothetical protein [Variovorax sp. Sphag1AA]|uniref:hypothetical protein n=1 Tax=Variovorax sp. Sphag1AA TaxID=2587027 RepID=UPI0016231550|nr:hypothetical protein [Variovorax sp. Sphag1AA]MBB3176946.1 hypothetical protein [Variovorax sp. Sphag1AA]